MKNRPFHERLSFALAGWRSGWRRERSFRTQVVIGCAALAALVVLHPAPVWWALVAILVALILALELINGAIEAVIDFSIPGCTMRSRRPRTWLQARCWRSVQLL